MKAMETIQDLIEEAKLRALWWALCIFSVTYFLSHTSSSMWMNLPISILFAVALRVLFNEVEFKRKPGVSVRPLSYLSHLEKKQMPVNDSRLSSVPPPPRWKRKIDSSIVEAAMKEFIDMVLKDFVVELWYSEITPDKEAPELMRSVIMDALGEISGRVKEINLVDLLTRDIVDLVGEHLDLFRRNQASIGVDVMGTLSTVERDDRLKHHLMISKELHPALISPESEYKFLQRIIGGVIALVLRPREAQCPLVRTIARELVTCLVLQPVMNLMTPVYINEVIESILVAIKVGSMEEVGGFESTGGVSAHNSAHKEASSLNSERTDVFGDNKNYQGTDMTAANNDTHGEKLLNHDSYQKEASQPRHTDWARLLEAANQRRTEVLTPENLENMWTKGRNYKKKENKIVKAGVQQPLAKSHQTPGVLPVTVLEKKSSSENTLLSAGKDDRAVSLRPQLSADALISTLGKDGKLLTQDEKLPFERKHANLESDGTSNLTLNENKTRLKKSNSASALKTLPDNRNVFTGQVRGPIISEFYSADYGRHNEDHTANNVSEIVIRNEGHHLPKLKIRVVGAYFEKLGSKSFAVYSIAVTDAENRTWFVKRRYSNFERLHRHLKDIPNYTLHLPPKRIFSSSTEDAFVHQRCIQLDKYLQDLLSIANVAEQHEVWDFLSVSSKNYSFGKSSSVMRTLAVNVDDAVDDIVRQVKGVSDGFKRKVVGSSSTLHETSPLDYRGNMSWHADDMNSRIWRQETSDTTNSFSDGEESHNQEYHGEEEVGPSRHAYHCHSDNELNSKGFPPRAIKHGEEFMMPVSDEKINLDSKPEWNNQGAFPSTSSSVTANCLEDPLGMPPEWTPPNVSVPILNLVDKVFQLNRRGWLRRQVFWISKQILQLIMEDAIDDWLLRQIYWLRREETVALGIRWVQDILWPDGTSFFAKVDDTQGKVDEAQQSLVPFQISQFSASKTLKGSFEEQLEAARRASDIKKMLFDGAPAALVSLIGSKQYKRCARDIFYFTQQLAYSILELLLLSVFPELRGVLLDIREKMRIPPA